MSIHHYVFGVNIFRELVKIAEGIFMDNDLDFNLYTIVLAFSV